MLLRPARRAAHCLLSRGVTTLNAPTWGLPLPENILGTVTELWCDKGSRVNAGEDVAVIETDKVAVDVKASHSGIVMEVLVNVGDEVKIRQPIYAIDAQSDIEQQGEQRQRRVWAEQRAARLQRERDEAAKLWREHQEQRRNGRNRWESPEWQWRWQGSARQRAGPGAGGASSDGHHQRGPHFFRFRKSAGPAAQPSESPSSAPSAHVLQPNEIRNMALDSLVDHVLRSNTTANAYACLGLTSGASPATLRKRYLDLALRLHPDKAEHPRAREAFAIMDDAFRRLWSTRRRRP